MSVKDHLPGQDWLARHIETDPDVDGEVGSMSAGDRVLKMFPATTQGVQSRFVLAHQLRASADIQDAQTKRETGWATTSDRASLMREAAFAIEALADRLEQRAGWVMVPREPFADVFAEIIQWSDAYPTDIFPEPDLAKARAALEAAGLTLDAVSASNMRHVITRVRTMLEPLQAMLSSLPPAVEE